MSEILLCAIRLKDSKPVYSFGQPISTLNRRNREQCNGFNIYIIAANFFLFFLVHMSDVRSYSYRTFGTLVSRIFFRLIPLRYILLDLKHFILQTKQKNYVKKYTIKRLEHAVMIVDNNNNSEKRINYRFRSNIHFDLSQILKGKNKLKKM